MSLSKKLSIPIIIINVLMLLAISLASSYLVRDKFEEDYRKTLQEQAEIMKNEIDLLQQKNEDSCIFFEHSGRVISALHNNDRSAVATFSNEALEAFGFDLFMVIREDGTLFYRSDQPEEAKKDMSSEFEPFQAAVKGERLSDIYVTGSEALVCATAPVYDADGSIIATVTVGASLTKESFVDYYGSMTANDITIFVNHIRSMTTLLDAAGQRIIGTELTDKEVINAVADGQSSYYGKTVIQDRNYLSAYVPLTSKSGTSILLFLGKDLAPAETSAREVSALMGGITAGITLISVLLILYLLHMMIKRPLKKLTNRLNEIRPKNSNKCNLSIQVPEQSKDECAQKRADSLTGGNPVRQGLANHR